MKKYLLLFSAISFVFLSMPVICSEADTRMILRSYCVDLSVSKVQTMPNFIKGKEIKKHVTVDRRIICGVHGYSTIQHKYVQREIGSDRVVIDNATGLMWYQSGSRKYMKYERAKEWLEHQNKKRYAGYQDWRLPTVEEAVSLLESSKNRSGLYIDTIFSNKQRFIWTGDNNDSKYGWDVNFILSCVYRKEYINDINFVRPVRSIR